MMSVDISGQIYTAYEKSLSRAKLRFQDGKYAEAAAAYRQCASYLQKYAGYAKSREIKARWQKQATGYLQLAKRIESGEFKLPATTEGPPAAAESFEEAITGLIHKSPVTWRDIAGLEETKQEIKTAYGLALAKKPPGVHVSVWRNILFYGPPGTGKTLLAAATSNGIDATFFNVRVNNMLSKYFGESTKLISALYNTAYKLAPSVVFLDEFEALSPPRGGEQTGAEARLVSSFLAELDGLTHKGDDRFVLTIAATNVPWLIDAAILSRFARKIYIPLPDSAARKRLLEINIKEQGHRSQVPLKKLADRTAGYGGREIAQLCQTAIKEMVARLNPKIGSLVDKGKDVIADYQVRVGPIKAKDWEAAFSKVSRRTTERELQRFAQWRNET